MNDYATTGIARGVDRTVYSEVLGDPCLSDRLA
jgi:hypothetical protein